MITVNGIKVNVNRKDLEEQLADEDTTLPDSVWEWMRVIYAKWSDVIPYEIIVGICRYENWRKLQEKKGGNNG